MQNKLLMQNNLLRSLLKKQLSYAKQFIMISFKKSAYLKQLIYAKQLIMISFKKNSLFETTYLYKTPYSKQLIYTK